MAEDSAQARIEAILSRVYGLRPGMMPLAPIVWLKSGKEAVNEIRARHNGVVNG